MAESSPVPENIRDMIELIASEKLQQELFAIHAPKLKINWVTLPGFKSRHKRAQVLADMLTNFMRTRKGKEQGMSLFRQISTIAIINADAANADSIEEQIEKHVELTRRLKSLEWATIPMRGPAILATFINIMAHRKVKPSGDPSKDALEEQARQVADGVWRDLVASATSQLKNVKHSSRRNISPPTITDEAARAAGIEAFCNEMRELIKKKRGQEKFYVAVAIMPSDTIVRYLVKSSPVPSEVMAVDENHKDAKLEPNRHIIALEILHDETHNRICISKGTILPPPVILKSFITLVLGSHFVEREKLSYEHSMQVFCGKAGHKKIALPSELARNNDRAWIASLSISLDGNLLPTIYQGNEQQDIYEQMDRQIDPRQFPEKNRVVEEIVLKVELHDIRKDGRTTIPLSTSRIFTIRVLPKSFKIYGEERCFDKRILGILEQLQQDWGFAGMKLDKAALPTLRPTISFRV